MKTNSTNALIQKLNKDVAVAHKGHKNALLRRIEGIELVKQLPDFLLLNLGWWAKWGFAHNPLGWWLKKNYNPLRKVWGMELCLLINKPNWGVGHISNTSIFGGGGGWC